MPSLPCPECGKELLAKDLVIEDEHLKCPHCGREIYERKKTPIRIVCPKCGEHIHSDNFLIIKS